MSDLISKAAAIQAVFDWEQGKISGTIADAIAAIPATDALEADPNITVRITEERGIKPFFREPLTPATDARADALREAAAMCDGEERYGGTGWECRDAILALIETGKEVMPDAGHRFQAPDEASPGVTAGAVREAALHIENAKRLRRYDWQEWTAQDIEDAEGIICAYLALIGETRT